MRMIVYTFYMIVKKSKSGSIAAISAPFLLGLFVFLNVITALNIILGSDRVNHLINERKIFIILMLVALVSIFEVVCLVFYPLKELEKIKISDSERQRILFIFVGYVVCTAVLGVISSIWL